MADMIPQLVRPRRLPLTPAIPIVAVYQPIPLARRRSGTKSVASALPTERKIP